MPRKAGQKKARNPQKSKKNKRGKGQQYILSARAQAVLKTILEDVMEETLEDAKRIAEKAGKGRVSLEEVEKALKKLYSRYCSQSPQSQEDLSKINRKSK
ncbi:uncharacterized protein LOC117170392 [Belonocnema kinseyi]|uniref:uncharacterized protein LOC117170392 n=1 Tax=Belonocnema kinseyi TaxID=2817044 RepID=UPI00143CFAD7|nr:uncharacterized protein LOC117170392 [Belonocnema kinseyi]